MTTPMSAVFAPISQRSNYRYLGMAQDKILRDESADRVESYQFKSLGWETALSAAGRFSQGRPCVIGEGAGLGLARCPQVKGAFNCCFWVQVEGESKQWVVRFPLKGLVSDGTTMARLRSEIATIQFLHLRTTIPVPKLIGYNAEENDFPPFMIMESVEGMRMTYLLPLNIPPFMLDQICKDLAQIHLELLSHPSDRIGMLDLSDVRNDSSPRPTFGPYSLDAIEHERDGVYTGKARPLDSAQGYCEYKCSIWRDRLQRQRNGITGIEDGRRKLLNERLLREGIGRISHENDNDGPYYLVHPDLHASNIILHPETLHIVAILDWEGACFLPLTSSCTPPKALFPCQIRDLVPESANYNTYYTRSTRYAEIFSIEAKKWLVKSSLFSTVSTRMGFYLDDASVLLIWALDDVRMVDAIVWQHIAWRMFPNLKARLDITLAQFPEDDELRARAVIKLFSNFAIEQLTAVSGNRKEQESWIKAKLSVMKDYRRQIRTYSTTTQ